MTSLKEKGLHGMLKDGKTHCYGWTLRGSGIVVVKGPEREGSMPDKGGIMGLEKSPGGQGD